jgi:hypothetical protein
VSDVSTPAPAPVVPDIHLYDSGWFEFAPQITSDRRAKLVRECRLVKGPTRPEWPSNRLPRPYKTPSDPKLDELKGILSRPGRRSPYELQRHQEHAGRPVGPDYVVDITDGVAAILSPGVAAPGVPDTRLYVPTDAARQIVIDDAFWAAYSRVRTCAREVKGGGRAVTIGQSAVAVFVEAGDLHLLGWEADELIRGAASPEQFRIKVNDRYVWPLRGLTGTMRQDGKGQGPTWWQFDQVPPVLLMPLV